MASFTAQMKPMTVRATGARPAAHAPRPAFLGTALPAARAPAPRVLYSQRISASTDAEEIAMLEKMLANAKRRAAEPKVASAPASASDGGYTGPSFNIKTFNAISPVGLKRFPPGKYSVAGDDSELNGEAMAIMLRSHKLQVDEVRPTAAPAPPGCGHPPRDG